MTEIELRQNYMDHLRAYIGAGNGDPRHHKLLDTYNSIKPEPPRGYKMTVNDPYCAATVSAIAIETGNQDIMPVECSCRNLIRKAQEMGIWVEADDHTPRQGDWIMFDWDDSADKPRECTGDPEHVAAVDAVRGGTIYAIEGNNKHGKVGPKEIPLDGRYIRGFVCPDYASKASAPAPRPAVEAIRPGDLVEIVDGAVYFGGGSVPDWVREKRWFVEEVVDGRAVIDKSEDGEHAICSPINVRYLRKAPDLAVGDEVELVRGATYYDGGSIPGWVFNSTLYAREINGDRVVISTQKTGAITGAVAKRFVCRA